MKKHQLFVAVLLSSPVLSQVSQAQIVAPKAPVAATMSESDLRALGEGIAFPYEKLDNVIRGNIDKEGAVFYGKFKGSNELETFARAVAIADLSKFPVWTVAADPEDPKSKSHPDNTAELTFFINAYNGLYLKAIADAYPVSSPAEIKNLDTDKTRVVAGQNYSFAELRRKIAGMDSRALFALPDGTNSGPRASNSVYRYFGLDAQLNAAVSSYVNDVSRVMPPLRLQNTVTVSPWLSTVDEYFSPKTGRNQWNGIRKILAGYTKRDGDQRYLSSGDYQVRFMPADRSLNEAISR
jgi:hypothetical protein